MTPAFELTYLDPDTHAAKTDVPLTDALGIDFASVPPVRKPTAYRTQRHMPGYAWFATTRELVLYESRLELAVLTALDFDAEVEAVAAQPFVLHEKRGKRTRQNHTPDYFARLRGGRGVVIDVSPAARVDVPRRKRGFDSARRACRAAGWEYRLETEPPQTLMTNIRALAGFRREPHRFDEYGDKLLAACLEARTIAELCQIGLPALIRPALFHLLWTRRLHTDLEVPLSDQTVITKEACRV